jgi:Sulfotransferase domain
VSAAVKVVYLGGLGRSGSTLLERLLGELPGVCPAGELVHMWQRGVAANERCGCGDLFGDCDFWIRVGEAAFGGWQNVSTDRILGLRAAVDRTRRIPQLALRSLPARLQAAVTDYTGYYLSVYRAIADVSGCETVVDSSKHASLAFCLARREEIGLRVIHLVRDSRAVAYSWTTKVARPDRQDQPDSLDEPLGPSAYMTSYPPARAAAQWNAQNGALQLLARRGTPVLRLRYEDIVAAPGQSVRQAARFAGLAAGDLSLDFLGSDGESRCALLSQAHTASGNPIRFATGKVPIRSDDRWRAAMPGAQRRAVTALTLPLLSHYGYVGRAA